MISNFKQIKSNLETIFSTNWTSTKIHYSGMDFDSSNEDKWINIIYEPTRGRSTGLRNNPTQSNGILYVVCWGEYEFDTYDL